MVVGMMIDADNAAALFGCLQCVQVLLVFCPASFHGDETKGAAMVLRKLQAQYSRLQEAHVNVLAIVRVRCFLLLQFCFAVR